MESIAVKVEKIFRIEDLDDAELLKVILKHPIGAAMSLVQRSKQLFVW